MLGHLFIKNPDLPERMRLNLPLNMDADTTRHYGGGEAGYTTWPTVRNDINGCLVLGRKQKQVLE